MKKMLLLFASACIFLSCSEQMKKEETASTTDTEMKALYEKNLATLKASITAFEKEDLTTWAAFISDTVTFNGAGYGDTVKTKAHWLESIKYFTDNWSDIHLVDGNFLPGIDSATHQFDGSVRYYGRWDGVHNSGVITQLNFYGTYDFNSDNKIVFGADFFDVGGLMNAVTKK